jgi:hypothetical protein
VIALCQKVDPLQSIIKDVKRWMRNAGHPQIRRELLPMGDSEGKPQGGGA